MIFSDRDLLEIAVLGHLTEQAPKEPPLNKYQWPTSLSIRGFCQAYPDVIDESTVYRAFKKLVRDGMIVGKSMIRTAGRRSFMIYTATVRGVEYYNIASKYLQDLEMAGFISSESPKPATHLKAGQGTGEASEAMVPPMASGAHGVR